MLNHLLTFRAVALGAVLSVGGQCDDNDPSTTATATAAVHGRCPQWEQLLAEADADWDVGRMSRIVWRESRCDPGVVNRTTNDWGLIQVHWERRFTTVPMRWGFGPLAAECGITGPDELLDAETNVRCAARLYAAFGMAPWQT